MKTIDIRRGYQDNRFILQYIVSIIATIMDKLAAIRAFVSVAEEGGFSAAAQELGVSDNVRFVNAYVGLEELCDYLQAADVYVTPYLNVAGPAALVAIVPPTKAPS